MTAKTYTRKVGLNRGKPRIWLEGAILKDNGFPHKTPWILTKLEDGRLRLLASPDGTRLIAGSPDRPVIDVNSAKLLEGFCPGEQVSIEALDGLMYITRA